MSQKNRVDVFESWAEKYDTAVSPAHLRFPFQGYQQVLDEVVRLVHATPHMEVLDLGIGTGNLAARLVGEGCAVWGVDFSTQMLLKARAKLPETALVQANLLSDWPVKLQRSFDRVVSAYVFHEFDLKAKVDLLRRIASHHLSAGGRIVVADVAFPSLDDRATASRRWADRWDHDEFYWAADETFAACDQAGLEVTYQQVSSCGGVFTFTESR